MQRSNERAQILQQVREISANLTGKRMLEFSSEQRKKMRAGEKALLLEYAENIPYSNLSRCPHCQEPLNIAMDLEGIDGPWWWYACPVRLLPHENCEHYQTFLGAMDLHDRQPSETMEGVNLGPAAPFVIARLLDMEGVIAVLSSFQTASNDTGYLVSYFSESALDPSELHQEWRKDSYPLYNDAGEIVAAESKFDPWDFEIERWVEQGKLLWIEPGDESLQLCSSLPCPYTGLPGTRKKQVVAGGKVELLAAPSGQENALYES